MEKKQIYFEDVNVGDEIPQLVKNTTRAQLFMYSAISWNVHRIHYDNDYAKEEGHPVVLVHGPLQGAFLGQFITDWISPEGTLKKISYTNRGRAFPDEPYIVKGRVTGKSNEDGQNLVECEMWGENKSGEKAAVGGFTVILPSSSDTDG
jgi:hydroxyacyl-ACP dehydratase HTD2-like protein with hotdog domain